MNWIDLLVDPWRASERDEVAPVELRAAAHLLLGESRKYQEYAAANALPPLGEWPPDVGVGRRRILLALMLQLLGQPGAVPVYRRLLAEDDLDPDLRVATVILAGLALDDVDRPDAALALVANQQARSDDSLARSLLALHEAVYLAELGRFDDARARVAAVIDDKRTAGPQGTLQYVATLDDVMFSSYQGNWDFRAVQPRGLFPLLARVDAPVFDSLSSYLGSQFKGSFEDPFSQSVVFQSEDPLESSLQTALFRVRCLGDWAATRHYRGLLAKYRLLSTLGRGDRTAAADLALLIRAGDADAAGEAANTIRRVGPLRPLARAVSDAANRPWNDVNVRASLAVVEAGAPLLTRVDAGRVLRRIIAEFDDLVGRRHAGSLVSKETLGAIGALLPSTSAFDNRGASRLLRGDGVDRGPLVAEDLPRAIVALSWQSLGPREQIAWLRFGEAHLVAGDVLFRTASVALRGIAAVRRDEATAILSRAYSQQPSATIVAIMIDLGLAISSKVTQETTRACVRAIDNALAQAAAGRFTMGGGVNWPLLLAQLLLLKDSAAGWRSLRRHIRDPLADIHQRASVLDYLAENRDRIPAERRRRLGSRVPSPTIAFPLLGVPEELQGAALRYRATFSFVGSDEALNGLLALEASTSREARMQAARSLPALVGLVDAEVLLALGLALAQDPDNNVRAWAARFLPALSPQLGEVRGQILGARLETLLSEPGEFVPLAALAGLDRSGSGFAKLPARTRRAARRLRTHPSVRVRAAARSLPVDRRPPKPA
jgi:hypothetical protein